MNRTRLYNRNCPLRNSLKNVFGAQFETGPAGTLVERFTNYVPAHPVNSPVLKSFEIRQVSQDQFEVLLHSVSVGNELYDAFGTVAALDQPSVERMAAAALTQLENQGTIELLNAELGYFIQQVSGDLEEVSWFRRLAEQVAACRADQPLEVLCERVLPQLRELLFAESIAVIRPQDDQFHIAGFDSASELNWHDHAKSIIRSTAQSAASGAVVHNTGFPFHQDTDLPIGINGYVTVQIGTSDQRFGWLVAINRSEHESSAVPHNGCQSRGSEEEFGTHEATLMESAAVLLATHAANWELFQEQEIIPVYKPFLAKLNLCPC